MEEDGPETPELTPSEQWEALKASGASGSALLEAIDLIENATPLSEENEPWRVEMMDRYLADPPTKL